MSDLRIAAIETRRYAIDLDPPFCPSWDPEPRRTLGATLVIVRSEEGIEGYASGDHLPDRAELERHLKGVDARRVEIVRDVCETVDFHGGRTWTLEVAVWDLVGRALDQPVHLLLGGRNERISAYASSGELVSPEERARRCAALRAAGVRACKIRFHHTDWRRDVDVVAAVRDAVGPDFQLMVDANQGWRMPGDRQPRWDVATAVQCARALEPLGVYWLEEPLPTTDLDGYRALRTRTDLRIAAGEMVRTSYEARDLVLAGVDIVQPDIVLAGGFGGCRRIAAHAELHGRAWSPHTWSNGYGFLVNLHGALGLSSVPFVEVPYDPPTWSTARRDFLLPAPIEMAADGTIAPPDGPGLGVVPELDALEAFRVG